MKKIPCLFIRDFSQKPPVLTREVTPGCEWVTNGEGVATVKYDGTACMVKDGKLYARYDAKNGKTPPEGAIPCEAEPDPITGHWPHWVLADRQEDVWIREAYTNSGGPGMPDGTYEAVGPKISGNHERRNIHTLVYHGGHRKYFMPRTWDGLSQFLSEANYEGIVFHHPDGRMCKIRRDDFGYPWPVK